MTDISLPQVSLTDDFSGHEQDDEGECNDELAPRFQPIPMPIDMRLKSISARANIIMAASSANEEQSDDDASSDQDGLVDKHTSPAGAATQECGTGELPRITSRKDVRRRMSSMEAASDIRLEKLAQDRVERYQRTLKSREDSSMLPSIATAQKASRSK